MGVTDGSTLHHTCFVVRDLEQTAQALANSLSVSWGVWTIEPDSGTFRGQEATFSFRIAIAQVGDASFELIEPLSGDNAYVEHLEQKGEGFHHTCLAYESLEGVRKAKDELSGQGRELVQSGSLGELAEFYYFRIPEINGVLELLYLGELPPPEKTIP